ncbi:hypothetical protein D3C83_97930 [compost metagenome]
MRLNCIIECRVRRRGNAMPHHERLGEILGAFESGRVLGRPEDPESRRLESVDDASGQRRLRAHHCQRHFLAFGERDELRNG